MPRSNKFKVLLSHSLKLTASVFQKAVPHSAIGSDCSYIPLFLNGLLFLLHSKPNYLRTPPRPELYIYIYIINTKTAPPTLNKITAHYTISVQRTKLNERISFLVSIYRGRRVIVSLEFGSSSMQASFTSSETVRDGETSTAVHLVSDTASDLSAFRCNVRLYIYIYIYI